MECNLINTLYASWLRNNMPVDFPICYRPDDLDMPKWFVGMLPQIWDATMWAVYHHRNIVGGDGIGPG